MNFLDDKEKMKDFIQMTKEDFLSSYSYLSEQEYEETMVLKTKYDIEEFLNEDMEHQNKRIDYILYNPEKNDMYIVASDGIEEMIEFSPYTKKDGHYDFSPVPDWDYNFDYYIFCHLEEGYKIAFMKDDVHYGIWNSLKDLYPEDFEFKKGVQNYLRYCKENKITKKYLDDKLKFVTPDVMKYLEESEKVETKNKKKDKGAR